MIALLLLFGFKKRVQPADRHFQSFFIRPWDGADYDYDAHVVDGSWVVYVTFDGKNDENDSAGKPFYNLAPGDIYGPKDNDDMVIFIARDARLCK